MRFSPEVYHRGGRDCPYWEAKSFFSDPEIIAIGCHTCAHNGKPHDISILRGYRPPGACPILFDAALNDISVLTY
jgi:hypothetical protein